MMGRDHANAAYQLDLTELQDDIVEIETGANSRGMDFVSKEHRLVSADYRVAPLVSNPSTSEVFVESKSKPKLLRVNS